MKRFGLLLLLVTTLTVIFVSSPVHADSSLQVQPLQYVEKLKKAERKKGFIDITNPRSTKVSVTLKVQGFKQVDNKGNLSFYDDQQLRDGIQLDYKTVQIPARKTLRLYFIADGTKLPVGDVFAVIFARITDSSKVGAEPSVQVGTLLMLTNQTPGARQAQVTDLQAPTLQIGTKLQGQVTLHNTASPSSSSGFFPTVQLQLWPLNIATKVTGPLLYAGNTRTVSFAEPSNVIGVYRLTASYGGSSQSKLVILVTGVWRWIIIAIAAITTAVIVAMWRRRIPKHRRKRSRRLR